MSYKIQNKHLSKYFYRILVHKRAVSVDWIVLIDHLIYMIDHKEPQNLIGYQN